MIYHPILHILRAAFISVCLSSLTTANAVPFHAKQIPADSYFVLSLKTKKIISDAFLQDSLTWAPILNDWSNTKPELIEFFIDPNSSGLNFDHPIHIFSSLQGIQKPDPIIGIFASVKNPELADASLHAIAENFKIQKKPSGYPRFGSDKLPYEFGRKGKFAYFVAVISRTKQIGDLPNDVYLDEIVRNLLKKPSEKKIPTPLINHFSKLKDASLYLDGTGIVRLAEAFWPSNQWQTAAPLIETITNRSIGIYANSNQGNLKVEARNLLENNQSKENKSSPSDAIRQIPGDSPLIAKWDFDSDSIKKIGSQWFDQTLKMFSGGQMDLSFQIPGFNLTAKDLLDSPSGEWILGLGSFNTVVIPPSERLPTGEVQLNPVFLSGIGLADKKTLRKLSIGMETSNALGSILRMRGIEVFEKENHLWFSSPEYSREIGFDRTLRPLPAEREKFLNSHEFALDLRVLPLTQSIRRNRRLPYDYFKMLDWLEQISNVRIFSQNNSLIFNFRIFEKADNPFHTLLDFLGQEIIDRRNASLYQAIAQNDFQSLQKAVQMGALINANDHFGHSPLHYAAYKGNEGFVDFLLRNGGDPNARSKHLSTPLHSAAWGRNLKVAEILLEDGADVNAETDEGETPAMTASLRGEKDLLEILFSLSADPHAKDDHGSNLYDLASAGGHLEILEILESLQVKNNHPFHAAAGKGDLRTIKKMLKNGRSINEKDAFGATPLIIATVSGKIDIVKFLLGKKADPKIEAKDGYTLMHAAAFSGKKELVQLAYDLGLDINARYGQDGVTPVDVGEDASEAMPFLESLGGRRGWELGRLPAK